MSVFKSHPFVVPVMTFLVLFFVTLGAFVANGGQVIGPSDSQVVRLYIDGEPQIVPTRAKTVGELLERRGIDIKEKDIIEPQPDTRISGDDFVVNYYEARPVVVEDKGREFLIVSAEPTLEALVKEAGLTILPEDEINKEVSEVFDPVEVAQEGLIAERVVVNRALPVKLNLYGKVFDIRTQADTVEQLVSERGIEVASVTVFPEPASELKPNDTVFVTGPGKEIKIKEETIKADDKVVEDPLLPAGERRVERTSRNGRRVVIYEVSNDGKRNALQTVVLQTAIQGLVKVGTRVIISNPSANVRLGERLAAGRGWTGAQWQCLYQLWQRESGWNSTAGNPTTGAYGIPQALPGSKMGPGWQTDANVQINWGLGYIAGRYGTPCGAWNFFLSANWY